MKINRYAHCVQSVFVQRREIALKGSDNDPRVLKGLLCMHCSCNCILSVCTFSVSFYVILLDLQLIFDIKRRYKRYFRISPFVIR